MPGGAAPGRSMGGTSGPETSGTTTAIQWVRGSVRVPPSLPAGGQVDRMVRTGERNVPQVSLSGSALQILETVDAFASDGYAWLLEALECWY